MTVYNRMSGNGLPSSKIRRGFIPNALYQCNQSRRFNIKFSCLYFTRLFNAFTSI